MNEMPSRNEFNRLILAAISSCAQKEHARTSMLTRTRAGGLVPTARAMRVVAAAVMNTRGPDTHRQT